MLSAILCTGKKTKCYNSLTHKFRVFKTETAFENMLGRENAGNQHFLFIPQCFLFNQRQILPFSHT